MVTLSSILKALKKIEEASPPPEAFPSLPRPVDSQQALNSKTAKRRRLRRILIFLALLLVVFIAAVFFYSQRRMIIAKILPPATTGKQSNSLAETSQEKQVFRAKIRAGSKKSAQLPSAENRPLKNQTKPAATVSSAEKFQTNKPPDTSQTGANPRQPIAAVPKPETTAELNAKVVKPLKKSSSITGAVPFEKPVTPKTNAPGESTAAMPKKTTASRSKVTYDRMEDSKLKLQALAWSDDNARRMAVINGQIVREGQSVDGYQIMQIRQEDVVVSDGGKSWRLEFGLQQ